MLTFDFERKIFLLKLTKHFQSAHAQYSICTSYLQLIDICMQLFADELTNQNREYYKVNDNTINLLSYNKIHQISPNILYKLYSCIIMQVFPYFISIL